MSKPIRLSEKNADFFDKVFEVVKLIPEGKVTSYGAIANYLGAKGSSRMVGWAMHAVKPGLPAHRVVNRNGLLTGKVHFNPPELMQQRLEAEGIIVINDTIKNFKEVYWDPVTELEL